MQNRLGTLHGYGVARPASAAGSGVRLGLLFAALAVPMLVVAARAAWLQTAGRERYVSLWDRTTERFEPIPAREGRILTADGLVLAFDETRQELTVHYRWFEDPPDAAWLKRQTLDRLDPSERSDPARKAAAEAEVLSRREQMHRELAALLGVSLDELRQRFHGIQTRVERIVASVEARREERMKNNERPNDEGERLRRTSSLGLSSFVIDRWETLVRELTTPPRRLDREPIVVAEELQYHVVADDVPVASVARLRSYPSRFPGVDVRLSTRRVYPQGSLASHVVGARTPLRDDELTKRREQVPDSDMQSPSVGDRVGRTGIELAYDCRLRGIPGQRRIVLNRQGEVLEEEIVQPPRDGRDVILSLDARLQQRAEELLDEIVEQGVLPSPQIADAIGDGDPSANVRPTGGCLVAIDVRTGDILAAAASPRHDARLMVAATTAEWDAAAADPRRPFFPRVTQETAPPGSVFKTLTSVALLESGVIDPDEPFFCQGYLEHPDRERCYLFRHFGVGHEDVTLDAALCQSCNVYFYHAAQQLGPQPLVTWAQRFGLGYATGIDLPGERGGQVPTPQHPGTADGRWYPGTTRQLAIGQASLTVTPLQVARMMAAVANDGWLVTPRLVRATPNDTGAPELPSSPGPIQLASLEFAAAETADGPRRIPGLSPGTLARVRQGLLLAVEHPRGTGRSARIDGGHIAGKTGTAEVGGGQPDHAWFAGYAPAEAPRIAFAVLIEHGGSGGQVAAPVAREFVQRLVETGAIPVRSAPAAANR